MRPIASTSVHSALLIALLSCLARPARAEEATEAWKVSYQRCQDLIREGNYPGALEACEQAYSLKPEPGILVHVARIQTALLHPVQARDALVRYLSGPLDPANRKTAEAQVQYLETLIATLSLTTQLPSAEIRIDDQVLDVTTLTRGIQLPAGAHRVTLHSNGTTFSRFIFLPAGEKTQLELPGSGSISLRCPLPQVRFFIDGQEVDAAQATSGVSRAAGSHDVTFRAGSSVWPEQRVQVDPDERVTVVCGAPPAQAPSATAMNPRGYWITGVGLSLGIAALATAIYNGHQYDQWQAANDSLRDKSLPFAQQKEIAQDNDQLMDSIQTTRKVAVGLGIAGALVTAGGVALLVKDSAKTRQSGTSSWVRQMAAGLTVNGSWSRGEIAWQGAW